MVTTSHGDDPPVVLFDCDGVVRHWRAAPVRALERRHALADGSLVAAAGRIPEYELGVLGRVTTDEWVRATADALEPALGGRSAAVVGAWSRYRGEVDPVVVDLVAQVRERVGASNVGLLSNAHDCLRADLRLLGVDHLFAEVVCSAEVGLAKPDPAIYRLAVETFGVEPAACLFVDDRPENVEAAREVGMRAHTFTDAASCSAFLDTHLG